MGRVYDVKPDASKGELPPPTIDGQWPEVWLLSRGKWGGTRRLCGVHRIEFDDDADEGMATIRCYLGSNSTGTSPILNYDGTEAVSVTFRHYVRFRSKKIGYVGMETIGGLMVQQSTEVNTFSQITGEPTPYQKNLLDNSTWNSMEHGAHPTGTIDEVRKLRHRNDDEPDADTPHVVG